MSWKRVGVGVGVMILKGGKVLLGRRHSDYKKASSELQGQGTWTMPGGKIDYKETFRRAACREVKEETGLMIDEENLKVIDVGDDIIDPAHFITIGLLCKKFGGDLTVKEPEKIPEWGWFNLRELPQPMFPPSERIVRTYLEWVERR